MMKNIVLALLLVSPLSYAEKSRAEFCLIIGDLAYEIAKNRDNGMSKFQMRNETWSEEDKTMRSVALALIEMVYTKPWRLPAKEADMAQEACLKAKGTRT
jgi:hypothetical protein